MGVGVVGRRRAVRGEDEVEGLRRRVVKKRERDAIEEDGGVRGGRVDVRKVLGVDGEMDVHGVRRVASVLGLPLALKLSERRVESETYRLLPDESVREGMLSKMHFTKRPQIRHILMLDWWPFGLFVGEARKRDFVRSS